VVSKKYTKEQTLQNVLDEKGRLRTVAVYTGPMFRFPAGGGWRRTRRTLTILTAACLVCALVPLIISTELSRCWYTAMPMTLALLPVVGLAVLCFRLFTVQEPCTRIVRDRLCERVAPWSVLLLILAGLSLAGQIVYYGIHAFSVLDLPVTVCTAALTALAVPLVRMRSALTMEELPKDE